MKDTWFAWYPVKSNTQGWIWLKTITREWDWSLNSWCDSSGYSGTEGGWTYK